jgi:hypothetical protein
MGGVRGGVIGYPLALLLGRVAELADAQDSGSCVRKDVGVQVPPRPLTSHGGNRAPWVVVGYQTNGSTWSRLDDARRSRSRGRSLGARVDRAGRRHQAVGVSAGRRVSNRRAASGSDTTCRRPPTSLSGKADTHTRCCLVFDQSSSDDHTRYPPFGGYSGPTGGLGVQTSHLATRDGRSGRAHVGTSFLWHRPRRLKSGGGHTGVGAHGTQSLRANGSSPSACRPLGQHSADERAMTPLLHTTSTDCACGARALRQATQSD